MSVRRLQFLEVLKQCSITYGVDPESDDFSVELVRRIVGAINLRFPQFKHAAFWPELLVTEQRFYADEWAYGTLYAIGDVVYSDGINDAPQTHATPVAGYWKALISADDTVPGVDLTYWEAVAPLAVSLDQSWESSKIGIVKDVYDADPFSSSRVRRIAFEVDHLGIRVPDGTGDSVWVKFLPDAERWSSAAYVAATAYPAGSVVYWTDGECYRALSTTTGVDPTNTSVWQLQDMPAFLVPLVARAVRVELLRDDGQGEKADTEEARVDDALTGLKDRMGLMQKQQPAAEYASSY